MFRAAVNEGLGVIGTVKTDYSIIKGRKSKECKRRNLIQCCVDKMKGRQLAVKLEVWAWRTSLLCFSLPCTHVDRATGLSGPLETLYI